MKKLTSLMLIAAMTFSLFTFTACGEEEEDLSSKIEEKIIAYQTDLEDSADALDSTEAIRDYLCSWAKTKGIDCTVDSHDNVIFEIKSSKAYKEAGPVVILCSYDCQQFENAIQPMAMALYIAKNNEDTGRLTIIFTSEDGHDFSGISSLNSRYFTDDTSVFCLNSGEKNMWSAETGAGSSYRFTGSISYTRPSGDKAYRISIKGLPGGIPDSRISSYPNPIKEIGDLLAYFKTNALIYELAGCRGGSSAALYPKSASATVVIDEDDMEKFQSRVETAIETFNDRYDDFLEEHPDVTYTYEEVDLPKKVMTQDSLNSFVSFLYTLLDGVYYKDEDDNLISITSIGTIRCEDSRFRISAVASSLSSSNLSEIDTAYKTICGLAGISYRKTGSIDGFYSAEESDFTAAVAQAFNDYSGKEMELKSNVPVSNASYVQKLNDKCSIISVSVNEDRIERYTGTIITFMMNLPHTEEE
ncbi:MAG: hypothetical protein ACI4LA_03865 [Emergencia sp.]